MNIYLNNIFYLGSIVILILYLAGHYHSGFSKKYYSLYLGLLLVYVVGISIAILIGLESNHPLVLIYYDLLISMVFPFTLALIGFMSRLNDIKRVEKIIIFLFLIFVLVMLINRLFGLAVLGDLAKVTTRQLFNISVVGFFGLYLLVNRHYQSIGRFLILISWIVIVLSLAKWNFFAITILPLSWIIIEARRIVNRQKLFFCLIALIVLVSVLIGFRDQITHFATGHPTWQTFLSKRVVTGNLLAGGEIRTGSRLLIWSDLLQQFSRSPILGIGFGARPTFLNIADHDIFIFFLVRFGLPLFCLATVLSLMLIIQMLHYQQINKVSRLILLMLWIYFFQNAAIDPVPYGEIINGLVFGIVVGIILNPQTICIAIKEKSNELTQKNIIHSTC